MKKKQLGVLLALFLLVILLVSGCEKTMNDKENNQVNQNVGMGETTEENNLSAQGSLVSSGGDFPGICSDLVPVIPTPKKLKEAGFRGTGDFISYSQERIKSFENSGWKLNTENTVCCVQTASNRGVSYQIEQDNCLEFSIGITHCTGFDAKDILDTFIQANEQANITTEFGQETAEAGFADYYSLEFYKGEYVFYIHASIPDEEKNRGSLCSEQNKENNATIASNAKIIAKLVEQSLPA